MTEEWPQSGRKNQEKSGETAYGETTLSSVRHKENWELVNGFGYSGDTGGLDFGEQLWTRAGDKNLTRFSLKEDGEIEQKEQRTPKHNPHCFVSAFIGFPADCVHPA